MTTTAEIEQVQFLSVAGIRPSPENEKVYRPVDPNDPDLQALADSIRQHGVQEPLVVSADGYLLSGHRRHVASQLAGLAEVPCRVNPIRRDEDPDQFLVLLREFNRQRVKSFDEVVREEVLTTDPEEAYQSLLDHRRKQSRVDVVTMDLGEAKRRAEITDAKRPLLDAIVAVLVDQREFWPVSDRQVHYALLNDPPLIHASKKKSRYQNDLRSYRAAVDILTRGRLAGLISFEAISDETRPVTLWQVHADTGSFIRKETDLFLKGYWRDLLRTQPNHIEIILEKSAMLPIVKPVAMEYCLSVTAGKGYCSLPPRHDMARRFRKSGKEKLVLLLLSDHDPDGEVISASFAKSMRDDFGIREIVPHRVALTGAQVERFHLPHTMLAKESSKRAKFVAAHGRYAYELEALRPEDLQAVLRESIESLIDREALNREIGAEKQDAAQLDVLRRRVQTALTGLDLDGGGAEVERE